jgi:hypothetical protein
MELSSYGELKGFLSLSFCHASCFVILDDAESFLFYKEYGFNLFWCCCRESVIFCGEMKCFVTFGNGILEMYEYFVTHCKHIHLSFPLSL